MLKPACLIAMSGAIALSGCAASDGAYPSLAIRDSERVSGTMAAPVAAPYLPPEASSAALEESDRLLASARSAHDRFLKAAPQTRDVVRAAQGAPRDSARWADAQVAIAELEAARASLMIALAELDRLTVDTAVAGAQFTALGAKRDEVAALADTETALITAMLESLSP